MKKKHSIHTIAKELGISATTVSFVANGVGKENRISKEVIEKIEKYLEGIDYQPNVLAKALRTGKTNVVGMLVEDISDPFFSAIARGVEAGMEAIGYKIFFMSTKNKLENAILRLETLKGYKVDGYIIASTPGLEKEIQKLLTLNKPVVLFDRYFPSMNTCNIIVDNREGAYMGAMELANNQYKEICFVTLVSDQIQMMDRRRGYIDAISKTEQQLELILEVPYNLDINAMHLSIKKFLLKNKKVDAILFGTNYLAIAGIQALKKLNLVIGKDIGVVGFDDNTNFAFFSPSISAVAQPVEEISKAIVKDIQIALSEDTICLPKTTVLQTSLIRRESSAKS